MWCKAYSNVISNSKRGGSDEPFDEFDRIEEVVIDEPISNQEPMSHKQDIPVILKTDMSQKADIVNNKVSDKQDIPDKILQATLTTKEIAKLFDVNDKTIHRWLKLNKLKSNKLCDVIILYHTLYPSEPIPLRVRESQGSN